MAFYLGTKIIPDDYVLVIPSLSIGNVGQLAVDLLIKTYLNDAEKVGYIDHPSLLPVAGHDPYLKENTNLAIGCEVFVISSKRMIVVQIRSLLTKVRRSDFVRQLVEWSRKLRVQEILVLGSSSSRERRDYQLQGPQFRYLKNQFSKLIFPRSDEWIEFERYPDVPSVISQERKPSENLFIPFGGICKAVYQACEEQSLPMSAILTFSSEGNNIPDALLVIQKLNELLNLSMEPKDWIFPPSWSHLFGPPAPRSLY